MPEMLFRRLLDKLPTAAYTCDAQGLITYFNQSAVALWGREPKLNDPVDRFCGSFKLYAPDGSPIAHDDCWMARALKENCEYNGREIIVERPDGSRVTVLAHANPIREEDGKLRGAVNVLVDITERKRAEVALKEADRTKNEFLAMLGHELRNPLAPIRNAVQILHLKSLPSPELQWALDVIDRQMRQMTRLIDDLLDVARITNDRLRFRKERIELAEVLHAAAETSRPLVENRGHAFTVAVPKEPVFIDGDSVRLSQIFSNLLNNAAKYTEPGGCVHLAAERQGSDAVITVRDTGVGIAAEMLPRIFELFVQGDRPADQPGDGLGVGLTLVKRLVEMHGGSITAESEGTGKGSAFIVRLPVALTPLRPFHRTKRENEQVSADSQLRILVVDDTQDSAATLSMLLRIMGNEVRTANDGLEALGVAEEFRPDVILLDIGLPKMDGYAVAQRIRQQRWGEGIVLIAVTGWAQEEDKQRSKEAGFDHHLVKPLDPAALTKLLASLKENELAAASIS